MSGSPSLLPSSSPTTSVRQLKHENAAVVAVGYTRKAIALAISSKMAAWCGMAFMPMAHAPMTTSGVTVVNTSVSYQVHLTRQEIEIGPIGLSVVTAAASSTTSSY